MQLTEVTMRAMLADLTKTGGVFDPVATFVGVGSAVEDHGEDTVIGDVDEGTGALETRVAIAAWSAPHRLNDGRWAIDGPLCEWSPADASESQSVGVWFYASAATGGNLKAFATLDSPVGLEDQFSVVSIVPRLCIDPSGNVDASVIING